MLLILYRDFGNLPIAFPDAPQKLDGWTDYLLESLESAFPAGSMVVDGEEGGREANLRLLERRVSMS